MSLDTNHYFVKQISHFLKGVVLVAPAKCQLKLNNKQEQACTGHFAMVPLNLTSALHCLQHSFFEHLFNVYVQLRRLYFSVQCFEINKCN